MIKLYIEISESKSKSGMCKVKLKHPIIKDTDLQIEKDVALGVYQIISKALYENKSE